MKIRKKIIICIISVFILSGTLVTSASVISNRKTTTNILKTVNPEPTLPLDISISLPFTPVTLIAYDGTQSYFDIFLSNVPAGYDVTNGQYLGWCAQIGTDMPRGQAISVMLYSSYDPSMPVSFQNENWDKINYILNHKIGTDFMDVQRAIWYFLEGYLSYRPDVLAMRNEANLYGEGYIPQSGEVIAILADGGSEIQRSFFEILVPPEEYEGLTPGFWKNHLDAWTATSYTPNQPLNSVFTIPIIYLIPSASTLLDALGFNGGPLLWGAARILLRSAVAALLNSAHPDITYPLSQSEILSQINSVLLSYNRGTILSLAETLDTYNNFGSDDF